MRLPATHRRSFVSTVHLSHTWENETVEAKARSLSTYVESRLLTPAERVHKRGNKSRLIARIQEHERSSATSTSPPIHTPGAIQSASTNVVPRKTFQAASPGIPLPAQPDSTSKDCDFAAIKLPSLSQPPLNLSVQVPYVPDFWNSARPKADAPLGPELPKLHVVSGSVTHYDGGPTHNLERHQGSSSPSIPVRTNIPPASKAVGFWADFWENLGLPKLSSVRRTWFEAGSSTARVGGDESQTRSRPLTTEERKGLYTLLGIVGGSWLVGGLVNRSIIVVEEHET